MKMLLFKIKMLLGIRNHNRPRRARMDRTPVLRAEWFAVQRVISRKVGVQ